MSGASVTCHRCAKEITETNLGRQDTCLNCGADTRVCKNCKNYDRSYNNECREEQAPRVVEKEKSNFCEWFQPRQGPFNAAGAAPSKNDLKSAADALFGKKAVNPTGPGTPAAPSPTDAAKAAAEALFKKKP